MSEKNSANHDEERDRRAMEEVRKYLLHMKKVEQDKAAHKKRRGLPPDPKWER